MPRSNRTSQKRQARQERRAERRNDQPQNGNHRTDAGIQVTADVARFLATAQTKRIKEPVEAQSEAQGHYIISIEGNDVTFATGPAGTGKTFVSVSLACDALMDHESGIEKIVITRPMVDADEEIGFLPGDVDNKFAPYFVPVREVLEERLGKSFVEYLIENGKIEIAPFAFMRGRTFKNAFIILDEAQNTTVKQMKLFLSRLGENVTVVIDGDVTQQDIHASRNGLEDALQRFRRTPGFGAVEFEAGDVRRSALAQRVVENYEANPEL